MGDEKISMTQVVGEYKKISEKKQNKSELKKVLENEEKIRVLNRIESTLMKLGLSRNEAKVYTFLIRKGEAKASEISNALLLNRTETYRILMNLQRIGLVSTVFEKPLKFVALPLEKSLSLLIEAKKMNINMLEIEKEKIIESWRLLPKPDIPILQREIFQVLEGYEHINLKVRDMIEDSESEIYACMSEDYLGRFYYAGLLDILEKNAQKGIKVMFITNNSPKNVFFTKDLKRSNIKYLQFNSEEIPLFIISDNKELVLFLNCFTGEHKIGRPVALYTNCSVLIKALHKLFQSFWDNSTK